MKRFVWLVLLTLLPGLVGASPAAAADTFGTVAISGAVNFRDVAADGLVLADGGHLATGVVYRSARLFDLTGDGVAQLEALGVTDIYDLRTPGVARAAKDPVVAGASNHAVSLFAGRSLSTSKVHTARQARAHMRELNRRFVTISGQRKALKTVLLGILGATGPVIIHCTEGKDRTGWVSAMLELIAGADTDDVVAQYLASNIERADQISAKIAAASMKRKGVVRDLETVRASYLQAGLDKAKERYGSIHRYLTKGVGLTEIDIAALREKLHAA